MTTETASLIPRDPKGRFVKGAVGNPKGRPKGAKGRLSRASIFNAFEAIDIVGQVDILSRLRIKRPKDFCELNVTAWMKEPDFGKLARRSEQEVKRLRKLAAQLERGLEKERKQRLTGEAVSQASDAQGEQSHVGASE